MNLDISCMNLCCDYAKIYPVLFATAAIAFVIVFSTTGLDPAPLCHSCTAYGCRPAPSLEGIEKSPKPMSRWDKPSSLDRKNYVLNHDVHGRWDIPESSDNCVRMYVRDDVCVSHAPSLEGNEKSPKPMSRWDKPSSLDRKNYVLNHDVHGRWDNPESSDNCVKYVCQR